MIARLGAGLSFLRKRLQHARAAALSLFALVVRYLFASIAIFVTAMIPVLFALALVAELPP